MGSALLTRWTAGPERFTVVDPACPALPKDVTVVAHRVELGKAQFDCIVAAVKPQVVDDVIPAYRKHLAVEGYVLSIAAGVQTSRLARLMDGAPVVRAMSNMPAQIGCGVSGLYAAADVTSAQCRHAQDMMKRAGSVVLMDEEDKIDRVTAVAGSGPGYVLEFTRTYVDAAMGQGFSPTEARDMVLQTMLGSIKMAIASDTQTLADLRDSVTSKGGTTAAGLAALNRDGTLTRRMRETLQACYDRAVELR